jgi:hypothetical protein
MYSAIADEPTKPIALDARIGEQRVDRFLVAIDDVEHTGGQPGFDQELGQPHRHGRSPLGRLEDESVAAGEREREFTSESWPGS